MGATAAVLGALAPLVSTGLGLAFGNQQQGGDVDIPQYQAQSAPTYEQEGEPEQKAAREEQRRRIRSQRAGMNGTLLSRSMMGANQGGGLLGSSLAE